MFRRFSELIERTLQKLTWVVYYQVPIARAYLTPGYRSSDIKEEIPGALSFATGSYAIYVLWQPAGAIPWYVTNLLQGLKAHAVNTIVVANHPLTPEQVSILSGLSAKILVRGNKGLDFGAYRDAILQLTRQNKAVSRLLTINDSVYVSQRGLDELLEEMMSDRYPVVSAHENWELHYHFQSFCVSFSGDILYDKAMMKFWNDYLPVSIRRWCINQGEVKLSRTLRKASPKFHVVYAINKLIDNLTKQEGWVTILQYREFIPRPVRPHFPGDNVLAELDEADAGQRAVILQRMKECLTELLMLRAQSHTGVFLFPRFLNSPFLKRDIVYRELFTIYEVERMLAALGWNDELQAITDEIRRRGTAAHLKGFARRRYNLGLI